MTSAPQTGRPLWLSLAGLMATVALGALDNFIVNPALPRIVGEFGGMASLSWVLTIFMLTSTITMPLYGKFSDVYGRRPLFVLSIVLFLAGSMLCGLATSMSGLVLFRAVQGLGAGGTMVLAMTVMGDIVSPRDRPRYQGLFNATMTISSIAGPVVGGIVTSALGWRWVFFINLPIGLVALAMIWGSLPRNLGERRAHSIDYAGVAWLVVVTVCFLSLVQRAEHPETLFTLPTLALLAGMVAALVLLVRQERRAAEPILAVHLLGNRVYRQCLLVGGVIGLGYFGSTVYFPLYFQMVGGRSPAQSGFMLLPQLLVNMVTSITVGQLVWRSGRYKPFLVAGIFMVGGAFVAMSAVTAAGLPDVAALACLALLGCGGGMSMPNLAVAMQNAIPREHLGAGTSTLQFCNQLAAMAGVAVSGIVLVQGVRGWAGGVLPPGIITRLLSEGVRLLAHLDPVLHAAIVLIYRHAFTLTFAVSGVLCLISAVMAIGVPGVSLHALRPAGEAPVPDAADAEPAVA
ncbi:MAG TPA: MDR family MFS transporter [Novosphingobium sp.]|nr:MDR family MFS transporter [Novosphingobium sp.]